MEVLGAVASIVTIVALAKEISGAVTNLSQGYLHAPKELIRLTRHVSLITLELECLDKLQHAPELGSGLTSEELWILEEALVFARDGIAVLRNECANYLGKKAGLSKKVSWALFDSRTTERMLEHVQSTEQHLMFVLHLLNRSIRAARAQLETTSQIALVLGELRDLRQIPSHARDQQDDVVTSTVVAMSDKPTGFQHQYTTSLMQYWRHILCCDFSWTTSKNNHQAAHELFMRLPFYTPRSRMAIVFSMSLRRSFGYLPNVSILGGGLNCFNIVPVESEIVSACRRGDVLSVRDLFAHRKASPNDMSADNRTLIFYAARSGSAELVRFLISTGAPVQSKQLFVTSFWRNPGATRLLLQNGANLDVLGENGHTFATYLYGTSRPRVPQLEFIDILAGNTYAYFNTQEDNGWTVMHRAAAWGTAKDVRALIKAKASRDIRSYRLGWTPLFFAVCYKNTNTLQELWTDSSEHRSSEERDLRGWNLLHVAICYGNLDVIPFLLDNGVSTLTQSDPTSSFVPALLEGKRVTPGDIARSLGEHTYRSWTEQVHKAGRTVEVLPEDIDWSKEEVEEYDPLCECCDQLVAQSINA